MALLDCIVTNDYYMRHPGIRSPEDDHMLSNCKRAISVIDFLELAKDLPEDEKEELPPEPTPGFYKLTPEGLKAMMKGAGRTSNEFQAHALTIMTPERAKEVRALRCEQRHSWRALAGECYDRWGGSWQPRTNQIMGIELCVVGASMLNEDEHELPWNDL